MKLFPKSTETKKSKEKGLKPSCRRVLENSFSLLYIIEQTLLNISKDLDFCGKDPFYCSLCKKLEIDYYCDNSNSIGYCEQLRGGF